MLTRGLSPTPGLRKTLAAAILLVFGLHGPLVAQGIPESHSAAGSPTLARVLAAWKARQERIKSFYFVWNLRIALPKGYEFPNGRGLAGVRRWDVAVEKDIEFTVPQLEWSGEGLDRVRSDFSQLAYSGGQRLEGVAQRPGRTTPPSGASCLAGEAEGNCCQERGAGKSTSEAEAQAGL